MLSIKFRRHFKCKGQMCVFSFQQLFRGNSLAEFEMKWRHWKDDCERRLEEGEFALNRNLEIIARVTKTSFFS